MAIIDMMRNSIDCLLSAGILDSQIKHRLAGCWSKPAFALALPNNPCVLGVERPRARIPGAQRRCTLTLPHPRYGHRLLGQSMQRFFQPTC
jgi:hypothetical protein